jgi:hypothetical protein
MKLFKLTIHILLLILMVTPAVFAGDSNGNEGDDKKIGVEVAFGFSSMNPSSIYERTDGTVAVIGQYARHYSLTSTVTGQIDQKKNALPISLSVNYRLNEKLYLNAGFDFASNNASSEVGYSLAWPNFNETFDYTVGNKVSYFMPRIGVGYKTSAVDLCGSLGIGMAKFKHDEALGYSEGTYGYTVDENFDVKGSGLGLILGVKYWVKLGNKLLGPKVRPFVKLEAMMLKVGSLTGTKTKTSKDTAGDGSSETVDGTLYGYNWNPYGKGNVSYWDVYDTTPDDATKSNFEKTSLNLSGIRLMIGISF